MRRFLSAQCRAASGRRDNVVAWRFCSMGALRRGGVAAPSGGDESNFDVKMALIIAVEEEEEEEEELEVQKEQEEKKEE